MTSPMFVASISGLRASEVASLVTHLRRAAIVPDQLTMQGDVTVRSRRNSIFSADDVLEVIGEWFDQEPVRHQVATVKVQAHSQPDRVLGVMARLPGLKAGRDGRGTFTVRG